MCAYIADESPKWNGRLVWQAKCPLTLRGVSRISLHRGGVCHFLGVPLPVILLGGSPTFRLMLFPILTYFLISF